ncbi:MAG TPA: sugar transferase [Thermoanaerobaculia bacterium]|jgi:lipopolysaccharide/colanic/teichoic acid biosynthesis glycosyltransferase
MIRPRSKERVLRTAATFAGDFLIGWGALAAIVELRRHVNFAFTQSLLPPQKFALDAPNVLLFGATLIAALALSGFYHQRIGPRTRPSIVTALVIQTALAAIGSTALVRPLPRTILLAVPVIEFVALPLWRRLLRRLTPIRPRDTILIGEPADIEEALADLHTNGDRRIQVVKRASRLDQLADPTTHDILREVEEVIYVSPNADPRIRLELLRIRGPRGFLMLASHVDALLVSTMLGWIGDQPLVEVSIACGYGYAAAVKRAIDVAGSALLILVSSPLWILIALATLIDTGRPILIRQQRVGLGGLPYGMWKFRSMRGPADSQPPRTAEEIAATDGRVTRVGALLRRYHLDELPQLVNVFAGDMSLVGPRPERPELVGRILGEVPYFDLRSLVRPGIAGLAQVSAEYETRPEVKLRYDLMYMCDWSIWLDFRLMLHAVSSSLAGTGR